MKNNENELPEKYELSIRNIELLSNKLGRMIIVTNRLEYTGNTIPFGAFCNAISFILYDIYRCKVFPTNDSFLWGVILFFRGIGQITSGLLEYIEGRSFPSMFF